MSAAPALAETDDYLLRLLGPVDRQPAQLTAKQWQAVDLIAEDQRLRPYLDARLSRGEIACPVPEGVAARWAQAYRSNAIGGLVQRRDLLELAGALNAAGIRSVALKGAWLAWHAYPSPAERVLRDLDLLVSEADAEEALEVLLGLGLQPVDDLPKNAAEFAAANKQFPPLECRSGTLVELHAHAWEPPGSMEWPTPPTRDDELLANATREKAAGLHYLSPKDMLAHLVIHAAYSHRFEVGPLLLADIDYLLRKEKVDWSAFWRDADTGEYARGAALSLAVVDRWRLPGLLDQSQCPIAVANDAVTHASALLLQPSGSRHDTRSFAAFTEAMETAGLAKAAAIGFARLGKTMTRPAHLARRLASSAGAAMSPRTKEHAASSASIGRWLGETG